MNTYTFTIADCGGVASGSVRFSHACRCRMRCHSGMIVTLRLSEAKEMLRQQAQNLVSTRRAIDRWLKEGD